MEKKKIREIDLVAVFLKKLTEQEDVKAILFSILHLNPASVQKEMRKTFYTFADDMKNEGFEIEEAPKHSLFKNRK